MRYSTWQFVQLFKVSFQSFLKVRNPSVIAGFEFLTTYPVAYLHRSFNLGRQFEYKWTVNWRFISEELFLDRRLHIFLLVTHLILLAVIYHRSWSRSQNSFAQKSMFCCFIQFIKNTSSYKPGNSSWDQAHEQHWTCFDHFHVKFYWNVLRTKSSLPVLRLVLPYTSVSVSPLGENESPSFDTVLTVHRVRLECLSLYCFQLSSAIFCTHFYTG